MRRFLENDKGGFPQRYVVNEPIVEDAMVEAMRDLITEPSSATVKRVLEDKEIEAMRAEYTSLYEGDRVECEHQLVDLEAEKRKIEERIKAKKDEMASIMQHINDNVRTINDGYVIETLDKDNSFKVIVDGHVLHYTYDGEDEETGSNGVFALAKVEEADKNDTSFFSLQTANQEVFIRRYGAEFNELGHFKPMSTDDESALVGHKLAVKVNSSYVEIERDTIIDEQMAHWLAKDEEIISVVVYAETDEA